MELKDNKDETMPLYDIVRRTIFESFNRLIGQCEYVRAAELKVEKKAALYHYKRRYCNFMNYMSDEKLRMLGSEHKIKYMNYYDVHLDKIGVETARILTKLSRELMKNLGLTQITEFKTSKLKK